MCLAVRQARLSTSNHAPASASRIWLFRILAALITVILLALLAEGAARVVAMAAGKDRALAFDPELGWRPLPNLSKTGEYWGIRRPACTNSHGWRDGEHPLRKPPGVCRALLLGDSFAFGLFVDDGERMSDLLAKGLDRLEVINMGITGFGTDQELRALETAGFDYSPDILILLAFPENDLDDVRLERSCSWPKPHYDLVNGELRLVKPAPTWDLRLRSMSYCAEFIFRTFWSREDDHRMATGWESRDPIPLYSAIVRRMADECREHDIRTLAVIAYPPERLATGPTEAERRAREALEEAGFETCDTLDVFREHAEAGESLYASDNVHWNAQGNLVAAEEARDRLVQLGWVPEARGRSEVVGEMPEERGHDLECSGPADERGRELRSHRPAAR